ncbi:MAG: SCO family protein [Candidatus Kapabacteria bacterium]|nr:SCO family protein [Ignavibacteriota bacterium]MCW5885318.1 SCO family protein [Candidatus Kapabacteria bacterium]
MIKIFTIFILLNITLLTAKEDKPVEIGIEHEKKLGQMLPMDLEFRNSEGDVRKLGDIINKPTVLALVYYHCPGICSPLLTSLGEVIDKADIKPGKDYQVLAISFDPRETYDVAARWKNNYLNAMERAIDKEDWLFMVGDSANVAKITDAVGFRYKSDGKDDFIHSGALIMISPEGKITRYLLGTSYLPFDFKMAIIEASKGIASPPITKLLAYCFSYDPDGKKYVFNFNKVAGTAIFLGVGIFFVVLLVKGRKKTNSGVNNG